MMKKCRAKENVPDAILRGQQRESGIISPYSRDVYVVYSRWSGAYA
jgi:hypothetical protein